MFLLGPIIRRKPWLRPTRIADPFQALAWVLVLVHGAAPSAGVALAWVHAVAVGWLTLTALAVLLHVIPAFTDLAWRAEDVVRGVVLVVAAAALALVLSFATASAGNGTVEVFGLALGAPRAPTR